MDFFYIKYLICSIKNCIPNTFINSGINTFAGKMKNVAMLTPISVPINTRRTLNILLCYKSLKDLIYPNLCMFFF